MTVREFAIKYGLPAAIFLTATGVVYRFSLDSALMMNTVEANSQIRVQPYAVPPLVLTALVVGVPILAVVTSVVVPEGRGEEPDA